jgi:cytochrome c oxidase subunit 2
MADENQQRGSALAALIYAILLVALTLSTVYIFAARVWWFPESITALGRDIDAQFMRTLWITGVVFFLAQLTLAFVLVRYRTRGGRAHYSHGNKTMEILWTAATAVLFVGLGVAAEGAWAAYHVQEAAPDALVVEVTGKQFAWNFRYPGPDGRFGRTAPDLINDAAGNPLGLDLNDAAAQDDIVTPIFGVPVHRDVVVLLKTTDVTHNFYVRELRFKQDTVPGMTIRMRFRAEQEGIYEVACAELCGLGHHRMRTDMMVLSAAGFEGWLREQAEF